MPTFLRIGDRLINLDRVLCATDHAKLYGTVTRPDGLTESGYLVDGFRIDFGDDDSEEFRDAEAEALRRFFGGAGNSTSTFAARGDTYLAVIDLMVTHPEATPAPPAPPIPSPYADRLVFDPTVSGASPVIRGTAITPAHVVSVIVEGWNWADILRCYPELCEDDIRACLGWSIAHEAKSEPTEAPR